jgi:mRNA interferase YafQ
MKEIKITSQFKKDFKKADKQNKPMDLLREVIHSLARGEQLDIKHRDHALSGSYIDCRECHISADWLLIYMDNPKVLKLIRLGSHSELF